MSEFEVTWSTDDGYVGHRPHTFEISSDEFDEYASDTELRELFWASVQDNFEQRVNPVSEDEVKFVEWAKEQISESQKHTMGSG